MRDNALRDELARFDPAIPIESAWTPPASWYSDPAMLALERTAVFQQSWQAVGRVDQVAKRGDYFTGCLLDLPYVVLRDDQGILRGFHNVCRHHAAEVCSGEGRLGELSCPYHGWTYRLDGRLARAPRLGRNDVFDRDRFSLKPAGVVSWGPLVFLHLGDDPPPFEPPLAELKRRLDAMGTSGLSFVARRTYDLRCNWKVYVDNYLDGGYHVAVLHQALAGQLDLDTYLTEIMDRVSIQSVRSPETAPGEGGGDFAERIGSEALYAFIYPNVMLNRYGPILDTNWVVPTGAGTCRVIFDYFFLDPKDDDFIARSIAASHRVQEEDVSICESVQRGLGSPAYDRGIYAPKIEIAAYEFHKLLAADLKRGQ
ncbi:MAG TPA: aromatic ring-hydroxylating dioxygenase subunit alpha [Candidatus Polarisedimenticolaceae bacterium]|nr:aromatic ring-hydroxylating dioxygenase subunit alpha [Candidatus Polarisedimenticolaceae bacterium]